MFPTIKLCFFRPRESRFDWSFNSSSGTLDFPRNASSSSSTDSTSTLSFVPKVPNDTHTALWHKKILCRPSYTFGMNIYGESGAREEYFNPGRSATLRTHYFRVWKKTRKGRRRKKNRGAATFEPKELPSPPPATFSFSPNIGEREVRAKWIELPYFDGRTDGR